jgi:hypothetical protein
MVPPAVAVLGHGSAAVHTTDSAAYLHAAESLLLEGRYDGALGPEILRPPGYPLFLVPGIALGAPETYAAVAQALLGGLTVLAVWVAARRIFTEPRAPLVAAWLVALDPTHVAWSGRVMAEALFTVVVATALLALVEHHRTGSRASLAVLTVAAGLAAYVRFVGVALPAVLAAALVAAASDGDRWRALRSAAVVTLGGALLLLPWCARNGLVADYWGFSTYPDRFIAFSMVPALEAQGGVASMAERRADAHEAARREGETGEPYRKRRRPAVLGSPGSGGPGPACRAGAGRPSAVRRPLSRHPRPPLFRIRLAGTARNAVPAELVHGLGQLRPRAPAVRSRRVLERGAVALRRS